MEPRRPKTINDLIDEKAGPIEDAINGVMPKASFRFGSIQTDQSERVAILAPTEDIHLSWDIDTLLAKNAEGVL